MLKKTFTEITVMKIETVICQINERKKHTNAPDFLRCQLRVRH